MALVVAVSVVLVAGPPSAATGPSFVTRSGSQLLLDGKPFRFTGINVYNAANATGCWYPLASGPLLDNSFSAMGSGVQVIRSWFFQNLATTGGQRDWSGFDHALAIARSHGVRVIPTLVNQWVDCDGPGGGAGSFKDEAWYAGGYSSTTDAGSLVPYRQWVEEIVTRYRDDPTILAWQLVNEAEVKPYAGSGDCSVNGAQILKAFASDVSQLVKSIDSNHLVSLGTIGGGQCGTQGSEYQQVHDEATIDLCEYHDYGSPLVGIPGDQWNGLQVRIDQCNALNKPLFIGEAGIDPSAVAGFAGRAAAFAAKFAARRQAGVDGELVWAWNAFGSKPDDLDVGPGDPVLDTLAAGAVQQFVGGSGVRTVDPGFASATAGHVVQHIDFDGDGLVDAQPVTNQYAAQGVLFEGLEARQTLDFTHSVPFGLQQRNYNTPAFTGNFSYVFPQPVASVGFFFNDDEGDTDVTITTAAGGVREFRLPRPTGAGGGTSTFYGYVAPTNGITRIDFDPQETGLQITDDLQIGTLPAVSDTTAPTVTVNTPWFGAVYNVGESVHADFVCADAGGSRLATCVGPVGNRAQIDTASAGTKSFPVTASDAAGNPTTFVRMYDVVAPDGDGDGVQDSIDSGPGQFRDLISGRPDTTGSIVSADPGVTVTILDVVDPDGVELTVAGAAGKATFSLCGLAPPVQLSVGSRVVASCGSVTLRVITGLAEMSLGPASVLSVPAGVTARVSDSGAGAFAVENLGGGNATITTNGVPSLLGPGSAATVDTTPPLITPQVTGTLGNNGWYRSNVVISWLVVDGQSVISSSTGCAASTISSDTAGATRTCQATSGGGTATKSVTVKRDATAPLVVYSSHPAVYTVDQTVTITCSSSDALSGIAASNCQSIAAHAHTFPLGPTTRSASATDKAGNAGSASTVFTVQVTPASLCRLTRQFVQASSKYQTLTPIQRVVVDAVVNAACQTLNQITPTVTPKQKAIYVAAYKVAAAALVAGGVLTKAQATTLGNLAGAL